MFQRFTESAREVIVLSQEESRALAHDYIGTEHILLGLLRQEDGIPAEVLGSFDITFAGARGQVERMVGRGDATGDADQVPFTPRAKKILDLALHEALALGHDSVEPEHILLGLGQEREGVGFSILRHFGADAETIRDRVLAAVEPAARGLAWEYRLERTADIDALSTDSLNELGADGWELAGVVPSASAVVLLFKRQTA